MLIRTMRNPDTRTSLLGGEIEARLTQLGLSVREFARRANIGRQTLHEIIHNPDKRISDKTFAALDAGLKWEAGASRAFHEGIPNAREQLGTLTEQRINDYLVQILQRLGQMDIDQLEREVLMLEEESEDTAHPSESTQFLKLQVRHLVDSLLPHNSLSARGKDETECDMSESMSASKVQQGDKRSERNG